MKPMSRPVTPFAKGATRAEMRKCGKRYATEEMAGQSRARRPGTVPVQCQDPSCDGAWHLRPRRALGHAVWARGARIRPVRPSAAQQPVTEAVGMVLSGQRTVAMASRITGIDPETIELLAWAKVKEQVRQRDSESCLACPARGTDVLHRVRRGIGYSADPAVAFGLANAVLLCAAHCAQAQDVDDSEMAAKGFRLGIWEDPALKPVVLFSHSGLGLAVWLSASGEYAVVPPQGPRAA